MGKNRRSHRQPQRQSAAMLETSAGPFESLSPRIPTSPKQHLYYLQPVISPRYILIQNVTVQNPLLSFNLFPHHHLSKNPPRNLYHPTPPATRRATLGSSPPHRSIICNSPNQPAAPRAKPCQSAPFPANPCHPSKLQNEPTCPLFQFRDFTFQILPPRQSHQHLDNFPET